MNSTKYLKFLSFFFFFFFFVHSLSHLTSYGFPLPLPGPGPRAFGRKQDAFTEITDQYPAFSEAARGNR